MNYKSVVFLLFFGTFFISCQSEEENPLIGTWEEVSSSYEFVQFGFEGGEIIDDPVFFDGVCDHNFRFNEDGSFENCTSIIGFDSPYLSSGNWKLESDTLFLDTTEPIKIQATDNPKLVFLFRNSILRKQRFSDEFLAISDALLEEHAGTGIDLDSLRMCCGQLITAVTTTKFKKL